LLLALSFPAQAQQAGKVYRIGILAPDSPAATQRTYRAFWQGLRELGYIEGQNILVENRYAVGKPDRLHDLANELVDLKVDVIVTHSPPAVGAAVRSSKVAYRLTKTIPMLIPIVMVGGGNPVEKGFAESLARPGRHLTGLLSMTLELGGKRLELFKEAVPRISRVAVLWSSTSGIAALRQLKEIESVAPTLGIQIIPEEVRHSDDFDNVFSEITKERVNALLINRFPFIRTHSKRITDFTEKNRLPTMYDVGGYVKKGGLMSYGSSRPDLFRRAAIYVDKILKGAKPADLPIERPTKFELVINLKTAMKLGITIPPSILYRADKVIK
jgi:putative ABC transport system substrate-binding protein